MNSQPGQGQPLPGQPPLDSAATIYPAANTVQVVPRKKSRTWLWIGIIVVALLCIAGAVTGIVVAATGPSRAVTAVVQNYYNAVEQQDYPTAYTYLDKQFILANDVQVNNLTQTAYTIASRTSDLADGKITAYSLTSTNITGNTAEVQVSVTRRATREITLQLVLINGTWEINRIGQQ